MGRGEEGEREGEGGLFESGGRGAKRRVWYKFYAASVFVGVLLILAYRAIHIPKAGQGRLGWICLFAAELFFTFYWVLTQSVRWDPTYHQTFKQRLSQRYESHLRAVDVFVCTADPTIEPPMLVINTVLSVMAYDYPPKKLSVYLSDDAGSKFTFYALLEAANFSKHWIPYCRKFKVEPTSPTAYFSILVDDSSLSCNTAELLAIKKLYGEMEKRVEDTIKLGRISAEIAKQHKGFLEWNSDATPVDHQPIVEILIDGRDPKFVDAEGVILPTLVYVAREKRPKYPHNFKAGALNALIRVSSKISDAPFILNVDCDMYSNNSETVRDALCFFMDEDCGHEIAFVQFPQNFRNLHRSNIYGDYISIVNEITSAWFVPFAYVIVATQAYSLLECLNCGETYESWWNMHRMRMMRRTTSYLFSFIDTVLQKLRIGSSGFVITAKVAEDEALERYEKGIMDFGSNSPMFVILAMLAMLNLLCFVGSVIRGALITEKDERGRFFDQMALQLLFCGLFVLGSIPIYQALFFRKDKGAFPNYVAFQSGLLAGLACILPFYS